MSSAVSKLTFLLVFVKAALLICSGQAQPLAFQHGDFAPAEYVPGEILVKFRDGVSPSRMQILASRLRASLMPAVPELGVMKLRLSPRANVRALASWLKYDPGVEFAEPNGIVRIAWPDDPFYSLQWNLPKVGWPAAMSLYQGKPSAVIAIIDTGVQLDHPDLQARIVSSGWDFVNNDPSADDDHGPGHGTHVAGIAAAVTNNGEGIAGMDPSAGILPVKVLNSSGWGPWDNVANGINYAVTQGAHVINMSLSGSGGSSTVALAVQNAAARGVVLCAAAGNQNTYIPQYPAAYEQCIAVGSTTTSDMRAGSSNYNYGSYQWVDVAAPGTSIYSTFRTSTYGYNSGTSMATPHVAGEAALLYALLTEPNAATPRSPEAASLVRQLIESNCVPTWDAQMQTYWTTYGRIKLGDAVSAALALPARLIGRLNLEGHVAPQTVPVTVQLFEPGTTNLLSSKQIHLQPDGSFSTTFASVGVYDVRFSTASSFLAQRAPSVSLSRLGPAPELNITLPNGDADGNGRVDLMDLNLVVTQFATSGYADLNGNGRVDLADLSFVLLNFTRTADP